MSQPEMRDVNPMRPPGFGSGSYSYL